ncbi:MAG: hypothetical protein ACOVQX_02690 [Legionella sp.]
MHEIKHPTTLNPQLLDLLFAHKGSVSTIFSDVLGLLNLDHIAIAYLNHKQQLTIFSSTPSLEFNLFNSPLWRLDKTYRPSWYTSCGQASWQELYTRSHYDQLYHVKQNIPGYHRTISFAVKQEENYLVYSFASHSQQPITKEIFAQQHEQLLKIGQYCTKGLLPLFGDYGSW